MKRKKDGRTGRRDRIEEEEECYNYYFYKRVRGQRALKDTKGWSVIVRPSVLRNLSKWRCLLDQSK